MLGILDRNWWGFEGIIQVFLANFLTCFFAGGPLPQSVSHSSEDLVRKSCP